MTDRRKVFHVEGFVPVVGSSWFLVISASVPEVGMVGDVRAVVERMIQSLRVYPDITDQPLTQEFGHEAGDAYFTPRRCSFSKRRSLIVSDHIQVPMRICTR